MPDDARNTDIETFCRQVLAGVARVRGRGTRKTIVALLSGRLSPGVRTHGLDAVSTFGILSEHTDETIAQSLTLLFNAELVCRRSRTLTRRGWCVMVGEVGLPESTLTGLGRILRRERRRLRKLDRAVEDQ
jgi:hypothetical protein